MKRIVYVGRQLEKAKNGGELATLSNQDILQTIFGYEYYPVYLTIGSFLYTTLNKLFLLYPGIDFKCFKRVADEIDKHDADYVFFDNSYYGILLRYIKKKYPSLKTITYMPDVGILYAKSYLTLFNPQSWYYYIMTRVNEAFALKYSDYIFSITEKDSDSLKRIYGKCANFVLSFSLKNTLSKEVLGEYNRNNKLINSMTCLFVGNNFFGNTDGLNWFIKDVLPYVDIKLIIVGTGMSRAFKSTNKVEVHDYVDDLTPYYMDSDFVLLPIISGAGMKTKTAEAMMWGKAIIATSLALEGYEYSNIQGIYKCDTKEEFINSIKAIYRDGIYNYNSHIHEHFVNHYSRDVMIDRTRSFFMNCEDGLV